MAIDIEKIALLRRLAILMADLPFGDINLISSELGLGEVSYQSWNDDPDGRWFVSNEDRQDFLKSFMSQLPVELLREAENACLQLQGNVLPKPDISESIRPLTLFASHLSKHKDLVQSAAYLLKQRGIEVFVAHESIEPSEDWQFEIEKALATCDGALAFVHDGFHDSQWCDQEMGWIKGRHVPFLMMLFDGFSLQGLVARTQGQKITGAVNPAELVELIVRWAGKKPEFESALKASAVLAFCRSRSFKNTDLYWAQILKMGSLESQQIEQILIALEKNDQIYGGNCRAIGSGSDYGKPYPEVVLRLLQSMEGFSIHGELGARVAYIHGVDLKATQVKRIFKAL